MRLAPALPAVILALALAGCAAEAPEAAPQAADASPGVLDAAPAAPVAAGTGAPPTTTVLERTFSGTILARAGTSETVQYEGDPPFFCFQVPDNTTTVAGRLTWDPDQDMMLEFHDPEMKVVANSRATSPPGSNLGGPIELVVENHFPGEWFAYAGPGVVGAAVEWELALTWTLERAADLDEVAETREC
jgi:hypothetical protein